MRWLLSTLLVCLALAGVSSQAVAGDCCMGATPVLEQVADALPAAQPVVLANRSGGCEPDCTGCGCGCVEQLPPDTPAPASMMPVRWRTDLALTRIVTTTAPSVAMQREGDQRLVLQGQPPGRLRHTRRESLVRHGAILPLRN